jgi:hypothetical protein
LYSGSILSGIPFRSHAEGRAGAAATAGIPDAGVAAAVGISAASNGISEALNGISAASNGISAVRAAPSTGTPGLLLTIILLTFEQYAEVPSKMHVFYREAFEVLAKRRDASKGAYKRALRTGLPVDTFADYFAELCFRSYNDEKFEMTTAEFAGYYNILNARAVVNDKKTTAGDFLEDLCSNLCLMYFEGNSYHFTHRSFQEYFCALFFSK